MGCNCEPKKYSISMGCCQPVLGPIENYYTKYQIDDMLEEIESAITSGCCITPEEVDEKIDEAVSGKQDTLSASTNIIISGNVISAEVPSLSGYATEQWVEDKHYLTEHQPLKTINGQVISGSGNIEIECESGITSGEVQTMIDNSISGKQDTLSAGTNIIISGNVISASGCDLSEYVTFEDMAEYVGDVYTKEEVNNLFVTKQYFTANTISRDVFITTIYNLNQEINSLKAAISACCGSTGETEYRWIVVPNDYTCSGTTKMTKEKQQSSTDGVNWTDTGQYRTGSTVLEYNSVDCGYVPVTTYKVEMRYNDGTEDDRQCDGSSNLRWLNPSNWENISGVTVGDCIDEIGNLCFYGFSGLTSVSLPNTITKIDLKAFDLCVTLPSITIPSTVTSIGEMAFSLCTMLTAVTIPSSVTELEYATFYGCESLANVELSSGLVSIGNDVFEHCSFSSITIPSTVTSIGQNAFSFNRNLSAVTCLATTPPTLQNDNIFYGSDRLAAIYVPAASVNAYKSASGWSTYANIIQPIP